MKMAVFWDVAPCNLVDSDQYFRGVYGLVALLMVAVSNSETSVNIYQSIQRNIPEDSHLQIPP
jgi:hypothetical protein